MSKLSSEKRSVQVRTHFCMYCGALSPPRVKESEFVGWKCDDCNHVICTKCVQEMNAVGKYQLECCWWDCKSNVQIKVRVKSQFERPVISKPFPTKSNELILADRWYVELNANGEWQPLDVLSFETQSSVERMPTFREGKPHLMSFTGYSEVTAEFEVPMDEWNVNFLNEGTLIRASIKLGDELKTMFQGFISKMPTFNIVPGDLTIFHVEAIEGEAPDSYRMKDDIGYAEPTYLDELKDRLK